MKRREYPLEINQRWWRRLWCRLTHHDPQRPSETQNWAPWDCSRCWYTEDEINLYEPTMTTWLHRACAWMCRHDWGWFNRLDFWLRRKMITKQVKPPSWWNY